MEVLIEFVGWLGTFLLSVCGAPIAWESFRDGHSKNVNMHFIQLWFWGEIFTLAYVFAQTELLWPLIANYTFNIVLILVILRYRFFPRINAAYESD